MSVSLLCNAPGVDPPCGRIAAWKRLAWLCAWCAVSMVRPGYAEPAVDFNRDIRTILSNNCFGCHGPDAEQRQGGSDGFRVDTEQGAFADLGGYAAIVRGKPDESELVRRVGSSDPDERMPPAESGKRLTPREVELLKQWIQQGAPYAKHWSYAKPVRPELPEVQDKVWPKNPIDYFILNRLEREGLSPSAEADRAALVRRLSLDLTGLPPTLAEVDRFLADTSPDAYEKLVDRLLKKKTYGEHWARMWLDLARYADSAGYADDPARTIWGFRDYVIRSLNANKPFDQFTIEQIAGDLLPNPTEEQLVATAFHRNTLTNNEGGTNDEEFRNVAIVDRVNTSMATWMGTTIACAQCHHHKYDPITQEEFFGLFAIFNNTEDADRRDESPLISLYSQAQLDQKASWQQEIEQLERTVTEQTTEIAKAQVQWEQGFAGKLAWQVVKPAEMKSKAGAKMTLADDGTVAVARAGKTDVYSFESPALSAKSLTALRLETLPDESLPAKGPGHGSGNFVISRILASIDPPQSARLAGRFVRVEIPGKQKMLSLAEVQVFDGGENVARSGEATQSSTAFDGPAKLAIDGNTNGDYNAAKSTTHTANSDNPWWEVDLKSLQTIDRIVLWNRTDNNLQHRLSNFRIAVLDELREPVWEKTVKAPPNPNSEFSPGGARAIPLAAAFADFSQQGFEAANVLDNPDTAKKGWAISPEFGKPHTLTLIAQTPVDLPAGSTLRFTIEQRSQYPNATIGRLRLALTGDPHAASYAQTPPGILALLKTAPNKRTEAQRAELGKYYLTIAPALKSQRDRLASLKKQLAELKPETTVPVMRELAEGKRRKTHLQYRGNFLALGEEVSPGVPSAFHPLPEGAKPDRLALARWLVDADNPLTARVIVNRYWEQIFGIGIVRSSEEFGSQGERPFHPELLDWLATELMRNGWDLKQLVKLMVTSASYRQTSRVTPELQQRDPDNRLLARGPRFRLSAEMIRDQALAVGGLLSDKMFGPPVKPPQPTLGLSAAFGSGIDWKSSEGEDRYRRGLYTTWRRSNPYPSMAAFDAPNREVCTVRRERTNTPLQALVTLNDPVYVEAAQSLARRIAGAGKSPEDKARFGFRLCLARQPSDAELAKILELYQQAHTRFAADAENARRMATEPLGSPPPGSDLAELAAWTVVGNVLLNLDEILMKR